MSKQLDDLAAAVAAENSVIDSAITLLNGLAAQIAALPHDATAIAKLAADVKAKTDALALAVQTNTPADPIGVPDAPPAGTASSSSGASSVTTGTVGEPVPSED